ncbi:hypothetical protein OAD85_08810, partial [Actinomycetota bacterium]|nr:hypothetical protein [Actinomycetota bacterium]
MTSFNEANSVRDLVRDRASEGPWTFVPGFELPRQHSDVLLESTLREALLRLNPTIAENRARADEVIYQ